MDNAENFLGLFGIYYGHLVYFTVIWKFGGNVVHFSPFWYIV
jgi:hypothetical protein